MAKRIKNVALTTDLDFYNIITEKSTLDKKQKKMNTNKMKFQSKLESNLYNEFTHLEWIYYFQMKYKEATGKPCIMTGASTNQKAKSVVTSLMNDYTSQDIKTMIDFLFMADHDIEEHKTCITIFMLSKNWVMQIHPKSQLWKKGMYSKRSKKAPTVNREWKDSIITTPDNDIF